MVQPRKEQIKNVLTRHSIFGFTPNAGDSSSSILDATLNPYLVSDTYGGSQESVPASARSSNTVPAIPLVALDAISVQIDGGAIVAVTFDGTEITASRIASKINTTLGVTRAFVDGGNANLGLADGWDYLRIVSPSTPTVLSLSSSVTLADVVPGTLAKLALAAGTYNGILAPTRGAVTESPDFRGGYVRIKTLDGKNVLTDNPSMMNSIFGKKVDIMGGIPIHGRLIHNSGAANYTLHYYARMPLEPEVITNNSNFAALDGTDTFDITYTMGASSHTDTITFPGPYPYTRDTVIDRINSIYSATPYIAIVSSLCQPFSFGGLPTGDRFYLSIDGGAPQYFTLTASDVEASQVAATILAAIPAGLNVVVQGTGHIPYDGNKYLAFFSAGTNHLTSSLEFTGTSSYPPSTWSRLGIMPGLYRGTFAAEPVGNSELKIRGLGRGSSCSITINSVNPVTLIRMGLPVTGTVIPGIDDGEQKVNFPDLRITPVTTPPITTQIPVQILIPEVLEFGEVDPAVESMIEQFNNSTAGSNQEGTYLSGRMPTNTYDLGMLNGMTRGVLDVGKPVLINTLGQIDAQLLRPVYEEAKRTFAKFIRGNFKSGYNSVTHLVASIIETPGTNGNPVTKSPSFTVDVDPDNTYGTTSTFNVRMARDVAAVTPFSVSANSTITGFNYRTSLTANNLIYGATVLNFADDNTITAGTATGGKKNFPLSNTLNRYTHVFEKEANTLNPSLLQKINATWAVTVGDGTRSFGDFNGVNAIQQAIQFWSDSGALVNEVLIQCKEGIYTVNHTYGSITVPLGMTLTLEGMGNVSISNTTDDHALIVTRYSDLYLKNLTLQGRNAAYNAIEIGINDPDGPLHLYMDKCHVSYATIELWNSNITATGCTFYTNNYTPVNLILIDTSGGITIDQLKFVDSSFTAAGNNFPTLNISVDNDAMPIIVISKILFDNCEISLRSTTDNAGMLFRNCGVIDLSLAGSCYNSGSGIDIEEIQWKDCIVNANMSNSVISTLIHLLPVSNGNVVSDTTTEFARIQNVIIDGGKWLCPPVSSTHTPFTIMGAENITVKNVTLGFRSLANFTYGTATGELGFWATGIDTTVPPTSHWGAFALYASNKMVIDNITFQNLTRRSSVGDMFIRYKYISMNDVDMRSMYLGTGTTSTPTHRIRFRPVVDDASTGGIIKNLHMDFGTTVASTKHSSYAIFYEPSQSHVIFDNLNVINFKASDNSIGSTAFFIPNVDAGAYYVGSTNDVKNLKIMNSYFNNNINGIWFSTGKVQIFDNVVILSSEFANHKETSINIESSIGDNNDHPLLRRFEISGNYFHDNGLSTTGFVTVFIASDDWSESNIVITNNRFYNNLNNLSNNPVIWLTTRNNTSAYRLSQAPVCAVYGNMASQWVEGPPVWSGFFAGIKVDRASAGAGGAILIPAGVSDTVSNIPCLGLETGHDPGVIPGKRYFANGGYTLCNALVLITP